MATTFTFGFTNTTASTATLAPIKLGMVTNYAKTTDDPEKAVLKNKTSALDQQEAVTYRSRPIDKVAPKIPVYNPATVQDGVLYSVDVQDIMRETRDDGTIIDHPIEVWITIKHDVCPEWTRIPALETQSKVGACVMRLLGACYDDSGVERYDALAKSALIPAAD